MKEQEINVALKQIRSLKSPGIDRWNSAFFKEAWLLIRFDIIKAILMFFHRGGMDTRINQTFITLILKITNANKLLYLGQNCVAMLYISLYQR